MTRSRKIGLVDLDTSHPASFVPILRDLGHEVTGVFESGTVWPPGYASTFIQDHAIPRRFHDLDAMAQAVDVAIIHTCNWDLHLARCEPFLRAGRGVLIDKPLVGNLRDAQTLLDWADRGARIFGGSSLRWAPEIHDLLHEPESERGKIHTVMAGCAVDEFNYGIHAYAMLSALLGCGATSVRYLGQSLQTEIRVAWPDGRTGLLLIGAQEGYLPFYATVLSDRTVRYLEIDATRVYRALLTTALPYLGGETDTPPLSLRELLEPELIALAAQRSRQVHGAEIRLADLSLGDPGYDGASFAIEYRRMRLSGAETFKTYTDSLAGLAAGAPPDAPDGVPSGPPSGA